MFHICSMFHIYGIYRSNPIYTWLILGQVMATNGERMHGWNHLPASHCENMEDVPILGPICRNWRVTLVANDLWTVKPPMKRGLIFTRVINWTDTKGDDPPTRIWGFPVPLGLCKQPPSPISGHTSLISLCCSGAPFSLICPKNSVQRYKTSTAKCPLASKKFITIIFLLGRKRTGPP